MHSIPRDRFRPPLLAALAATALCAGPLAAQRVDFDGVASRGDRPETRRMLGYAARVSFPLLPFVDLSVGYSRLAGSGTIDHASCGGFGCVDEPLANDFVFGTVDYEVMVPLRLLGVELSAAAGVDVTTVRSAEVRGLETGQPVRARVPEHGLLASLTALNGRHYRFGAGISPPGLPVTLRLAWQRRTMDLDGCAAEGWAPFCGEMRSDQLLFGVSLGTR